MLVSFMHFSSLFKILCTVCYVTTKHFNLNKLKNIIFKKNLKKTTCGIKYKTSEMYVKCI